MRDQATLPATHEVDSRHGYAILLMVLGSVAISFGGLILRSIEVADTWQINVYRSFGMFVAIAAIIWLNEPMTGRRRQGGTQRLAEYSRISLIAQA